MKELETINKMKKFIFLGLFCASFVGFSQEGNERITATFEDTRIVNGHSVETQKEGSMKFIIAHRFGAINSGIHQLGGLDNSQIRLGFDYGISDNVTIGVGRSSFEKTLDGFIKVKLIHQSKGGSPISLVAFQSADIFTYETFEPFDIETKYRWNYVTQLLIARKFSDRISLQVMPTYLHKNLVKTGDLSNDILSLGAAGKIQLTKILSFKAEYYYTLPDQLSNANTNSLALGFDIETKHHVFQMHLGNSRGMIERYFISETFGKWTDADIMFGFNITRDFQIKGRKYK